MKLYEYTFLQHRSIVIAAHDEAAAKALLDSLELVATDHGDATDASDVELFDVREMKARDPHDEAHYIA